MSLQDRDEIIIQLRAEIERLKAEVDCLKRIEELWDEVYRSEGEK